MIYEKYEIVSNDNPHLYTAASEHWNPRIDDLLAFSQEANMKPLTSDDIKHHALGCSIIGTWYDLPFPDHHGVLSYAGITDSDEWQGKKCMVIGGVLVHPDFQEIGLGTLTVNWLVKTASSEAYCATLEYDGFITRCNTISAKLFARLGFIAVEEEKSKTTMFKTLIK